jgi:hypothetical protein
VIGQAEGGRFQGSRGFATAAAARRLRRVDIITACDAIARDSYERLRARAMVLLMRYEGLDQAATVPSSRQSQQAPP